jgi:hypothetical protein
MSHAGGKQGYRSGYVFNPDTRVGVVVLATRAPTTNPSLLRTTW